MNLNQLHENEAFLENRKSKIIKITDKTIQSLKNEMNWEGNGSDLDPIVIERVNSLPLIVKIYRSNLYYNIKNLTIDKLTCRNTHYITIENCTIKHLKIDNCDNITLLNNTVFKLKMKFTKGSTFKDNKFTRIDEFNRNYYTTQGNPIGKQLTNPLTCCLYFLTIGYLLSGLPFWFIGFIPFGVLILLDYLSYIKNKKMREKPDNIYKNNIEL